MFHWGSALRVTCSRILTNPHSTLMSLSASLLLYGSWKWYTIPRFPFLLPVSVSLRVRATRYVFANTQTDPHSTLMSLSASIALGGVPENGRLLRESVGYAWNAWGLTCLLNRQTGRQTDRDRQTDRQTDRHTHTHTHTQRTSVRARCQIRRLVKTRTYSRPREAYRARLEE